jgi:hypothetical protein
MSIISALKTYLATYSGLTSGAPLWVDYLSSGVVGYSVMPLPGTKKVETFIDSARHYTAEYPFAFQVMASTADDPNRIANLGFFEAFSDWLESQTESGVLPTLGAKQTPEKIEAIIGGYLLEQGSSETAVYQISCKLTYEQTP